MAFPCFIAVTYLIVTLLVNYADRTNRSIGNGRVGSSLDNVSSSPGNAINSFVTVFCKNFIINNSIRHYHVGDNVNRFDVAWFNVYTE